MKNTRISPAQRHYARLTAAKGAAAASPGTAQTGTAYELMLRKLAEDRRRLKQVQSIERKAEVKRALLPEYQDYLTGVITAGNGAQDDVVTTVLVWLIDIGDYAAALVCADYALTHKLSLPDQYNRDVATLLLDEISSAYLTGKFTDPDNALPTLIEVARLTESHDAPDQARAKLHKAIATATVAKIGDGDIDACNKADAESALTHLQRALELFDGIGVKKDIERLERRIKNATPD